MPSHRFSARHPSLGARPRVRWPGSRRGIAPTTFIAILSRSASIRFCAGATKSLPAAIASRTDPARMIRIPAESVVSSGVSAVHDSDITCPGGVTAPRLKCSAGSTGPFSVHLRVSGLRLRALDADDAAADLEGLVAVWV